MDAIFHHRGEVMPVNVANRGSVPGLADDGVGALAAHPRVLSLPVAEKLYADLAYAHRAHLPDRLLPR